MPFGITSPKFKEGSIVDASFYINNRTVIQQMLIMERVRRRKGFNFNWLYSGAILSVVNGNIRCSTHIHNVSEESLHKVNGLGK